MEAPNADDTTDPDKGYITVGPTTDRTGQWVHELFTTELPPNERLTIVNSTLCLPPHNGDGYPVTGERRRNCSVHLRAQIDLIDPVFVAVLGGEALEAANRIERHGLPGIKKCAGQHIAWYGRQLLALAHPSPLARANRKPEMQRQDWRRLGALLLAGRS